MFSEIEIDDYEDINNMQKSGFYKGYCHYINAPVDSTSVLPALLVVIKSEFCISQFFISRDSNKIYMRVMNGIGTTISAWKEL